MTAILDANIIKNAVASGGDKFIARKNHKNENDYINRSTAFAFVNDMPKIQPYDDATDLRVKTAEYKKVFTPHPNPNNPIECLEERTYRDLFKQDEYKDALLTLLIEAYQEFKMNGCEVPASAIQSKKEWIGDEMSLTNLMSVRYETTTDDNDYVVFDDISSYLQQKGVPMSKTKISKELTRLMFGRQDEKCINGKTTTIRRRMKLKNKSRGESRALETPVVDIPDE
jgi:phage/plasmid-associated DNA primase